jgi:hypothetical protein
MANANDTACTRTNHQNQDAALTTLTDPENSTLWGLVLNLNDIHATMKLLEQQVGGHADCERCHSTESVTHMLINNIRQCEIAAHSFSEKYEEGSPDKIDDGLFLYDVSCKIHEAAVVLKHSQAEYKKEGNKDDDALSVIKA